MKNRKSVYLLICCVIAVWGIIGYRIYAATTGDETTPISSNNSSRKGYFKLIDHSQDTYSLHADYPDPFRGFDDAPEEKPLDEHPIVSQSSQNTAFTKPEINWYGILFLGYILNPQSKKKVGIFSVNGHETMLSEGEQASGLKINKFVGDSVKVTYQKASKFISIKRQ
ncbi:hypothetical protein DHW03_03230 [Pedobacter yonginense]|uniref:Type II secretion system protein GspC N-terminal domain-containing protein n=1 Tax=Pedobacter yonginense TaxID=651869 RepID=A0A317EPN4_9SPHI|nr:hypothetical protein [Pedobacter yonginense]PWS28860.1 hypothetical protein DHW03_03230 [Pedobacter yonginense]